MLAWSELAGPNGLRGPRHQDIRRFFRWLERGGAVKWDAYLKEFHVADRAALARLMRWDGQQALTAAFRAGHVADAEPAAVMSEAGCPVCTESLARLDPNHDGPHHRAQDENQTSNDACSSLVPGSARTCPADDDHRGDQGLLVVRPP